MFIARQPMLDKNKNTIGYELLYRDENKDNKENESPGFNGDKATAHVLTGYGLGINELTEGKLAFINFTEKILIEGLMTVIPKHLLGIEILETVIPTKQVVNICREYKDKGYLIILDDFVFEEERLPFVDIADIIKVDFLNTGDNDINSILDNVRPGTKLLAEKIETNEHFAKAISMNFDYFQGYFFSKPEIIQGKELPAYKINYIDLLTEINKPDSDFNKIEKILKSNISVSYSLLKLINSAYFGLNCKVKSIKQTLALLGAKKIKKWLTLYFMRDLSEEKPDILFKTALIRANFTESLATYLTQIDRKLDLYMVGWLSMADAFFDMPLEKILDDISLSEEIEEALISHIGAVGRLIKLVINYEQGKWTEVKSISEELNLNINILSNCYFKALKEVNDTISVLNGVANII